MKDLTDKQTKEIEKFSQIIDVSNAIYKHIENFDGETEQLEGALSLAVTQALRKADVENILRIPVITNAVVTVELFSEP
jgi:uncharacterized protein YjaG (DUF416 family)